MINLIIKNNINSCLQYSHHHKKKRFYFVTCVLFTHSIKFDRSPLTDLTLSRCVSFHWTFSTPYINRTEKWDDYLSVCLVVQTHFLFRNTSSRVTPENTNKNARNAFVKSMSCYPKSETGSKARPVVTHSTLFGRRQPWMLYFTFLELKWVTFARQWARKTSYKNSLRRFC